MTRKHILLSLIATAMLLGACAYGWRQWRLAHPDRSHEMTALTQNLRTHCVGRLLIDLPEGSTWKPDASGATIGGIKLAVETDISQEWFKDYIEQRWQEIEAKKSRSKRYVQRSAERTSPLTNSAVFTYGFRRVEGPDVDGVYRNNIFHDAEGYYWVDGTLFKLGPALNGQEKIAALLPRLYARKADEIPFSPGLCLNGGFVRGYYDLGESEEVSWGFSLPRNMGIAVRHTKVSTPATSLFQRERESRDEAAAYLSALLKPEETFKEHLFRQATRQVGELRGEELIVGSVEDTGVDKYVTSIDGIWEYTGKGAPSFQPQIKLILDTPSFLTTYIPSPAGGFPKWEDTPDGPTEAEFFEVWDTVVASVRFRPGALTPPPLKPAPAAPISREQAEADQRFLDDFIASRPGGAGKPPE
ncbi:T6SS immunity protein Tli4 family protein [Pseudomonas citronellolis]|nr:T6SS immunity protein Tli4 family protein [Pseudomonas citronellolis]